MLIDSGILKEWILEDKRKSDSAYGNNLMLQKGYGRCLMLIDELEKSIPIEASMRERLGNDTERMEEIAELAKIIVCKDCIYFNRDKIYKSEGTCLLDNEYTREHRVCNKPAVKIGKKREDE